MSDSAKLQFVYGIIFLVFSFLLFGGALSLFFLVGFSVIATDFTALGLFMILLSIFFIYAGVFYFIECGKEL